MRHKIFTWLFAAMLVAGAIFFIKPQAAFAAEGDHSALNIPAAAETQTTITSSAPAASTTTPSTAAQQTPMGQTAPTQKAEAVTTQSSNAVATPEQTAASSAPTTSESASLQQPASTSAVTSAQTQQDTADENNADQSTNTNQSTQTAAAGSTGGQSAATAKSETTDSSYSIQVNNTDKRNVAYGESLSLGLSGYSGKGRVEFSYANDADVTNGNWHALSDALTTDGHCRLAPGTYYLQYSLTETIDGSDSTVSVGSNKEFMLTVEKGTIGAPTGLTWTGSQMSWTAPTVTTKGGTVDSGAVIGYTLCVYKGDTLVFTTSTDATHYDNFANNIIGDFDKGSGRYTFKVQALTAESNDYYNHEGAVSTESGAYVVPLVTVIGDAGIASTNPGTSFLLLPGNADHNQAAITATVQDGYQFAGWRGTGVTFVDVKSASTTVTINPDYSGDTSLTITAASRDNAAPIITTFAGKDHTALTATATDGQTGIVKYAFTTKSNQKDLTDSDWTAVENPAAGTKTFIYTLSDGGTYYFYAQDGNGNIAKSGPLDVTKITYKNYAKPDDATDHIEYLIGSETYLLSEPSYGAYDFKGWYLNSDFSGDAQTKITAHQDQGYTFYAKWTRQTISNMTLKGVTKVYDGQGYNLSVNPSNTGSLSYQWFKDGQAIENATVNTLTVKNVADSGTYKVVAKLKDDDGKIVATKESNTVTVCISKRPVIIKAQDQTITYGAEPVSSYLYIYEKVPGNENSGLVEGDEKQITAGTLSCEYKQGDSTGNYAITIQGFSSDNYDITMTPGTLTVNPKSVDNVTADLAENSYTYAGSEIQPAVTVRDGATTLTEGSDYTVAYTNNINVGEATATVKFQGNYEGSKALTFSITKADYDSHVAIDGWTYGNTANTPTVDANPGGGAVTYYYAKTGSESYTTVQPTQAGSYKVYAIIAATDNYNGVTTATQKFTIAKRQITIKAADASFEYDGAAHSANTWSYVDGTFASGEGFFAVTVKGSATDVTGDAGVANVITYTLTSSTNPDNYSINAQNGKIVITPANLTVPSQPGWSAEAPGTASWIAVAKKDLTVAYKLTLYAYDGTTYTQIGDPVTVSGTSYNFSDAIRTYAAQAAAEGKAYRYAFSIQSISSGGTNQKNYANSAISEKIGNLLTAAVTLEPNDHLSTLTIGGQNAGTYILLQGERVAIAAKANEGWKFSAPAFTADTGLSLSEGAVSDELTHDNFSAIHSASAVMTMPTNAAASVIGQIVRVNTEDDVPWITNFTANNMNDLKEVTFNFTMGDANGLAAWALTTSKDAPAEDADVWHSLSENPTTYTGSASVNAAGTYYLYAKDQSGHIITASTVSVSGGIPAYTQKSINVYALTLNSGSGTGADQTLYKIENTTVALPSLTTLGFSKTGYAFQNWYGASGIYEDEGGYAANSGDTLTAHWTNEHFDVQVKYFYMGVDGKYSDTPSATVSYNELYGTKVQSTDDLVKRDQIGFTRDDDLSRKSEVTVTSAGQSLNVYYKRNAYTITQTYTMPGAKEKTSVKRTFYFGADVSSFLNAKPSAQGYTFVGWTFEGSGGQPATMPAHDVSASGTFEAQPATYHIVTYTQDLNADGTLADTYSRHSSRDVTTVNDAAITFGAAQATAIEGFTYDAVAVTTGSGSATKPADASAEVRTAAKTAKSETDKGNEVYINVYYTRNAYTLTQNVWKGEVGGSGNLLRNKSWTLYYGAPISAADYANDDLTSIAPGSGYTLASYVGWSTNTAPTTMPAGNVTCTRQYVSNVEGQYQVEVYIEGDDPNTYTKQTYHYTGNVGATVTIGKEDTDTIKYNNLSSSIPYFDYLQYKSVTQSDIDNAVVHGASGVTLHPTVTSTAVTNTNDGETPAVLYIYLERKPITATIHYYYNVNGTNVEMAAVTKTQKWGPNSTFDYEALALFDTVSGGKWKGTVDPNSLTYKVTIDRQNPDAYDFRNNGYVVSFTASYDLNDTHYYNSYRYDSEASLTGNDIGAVKRIMGYANNVVNVYYTKPDPSKQFYLDVVYNSGAFPGLTHGENQDVPVTYTYEGTTYKLRYQNEATFYKDAKYIPDTHTAYPGLAYLNTQNGDASAASGRYIYSTDASDVKDSYTRVEINGKNYFISGDYLYIPITDNNYFLNNLTSVVIGKSDSEYTVNSDELASTDITNFLDNYRKTYADEAKAKGAHVYNHAWGSDIVTGNSVLRVTFEDARIVHLRYVVNGTSSYQKEYAQGETVKDFSDGNKNYPTKAGYHLVWYTDPACTQQAQSLTMDTDRNVYGQYEKDNLANTVYAYYELADAVTKNGITYHYITEKDLGAFAGDTALQSSTDKSGVTTWTYNGQIVMVRKAQTSSSFATITMNADDYKKDDFTFDDANDDNCLTSYVESAPVTLRAYFKRGQYEMTVDENKENANAVTDQHRVGETIQLRTPSRDGYTFTGWQLTQVTSSGEQDWQTIKDTSFTMPNTHIKAVAQWSPAAFTQNIVHYYQNPDSLTYNQTEVAAMMAAQTSTDVTVDYNGTCYTGKLYANGGVTFEINGTTYYIATPTKKSETSYSASSRDLSAVAIPVSVKQDTAVRVADNENKVDHYNFASAVYQYENTLTQFSAEDQTYTNKYGMKLSYFYTLQTGLDVTLQVIDDQGTANPSCTLTGAGQNYHYGQSVPISAVLGAGYTFVGWYKASDVLDSNGQFIQDYKTKTAVSKDPSFTQTIEGNYHYVAVVSALDVAQPTLTVSGQKTLTYGYEVSQNNSVSIQAVFADGTNKDDVNYIASYQWYCNGKAIDGATSAAYLIPEGLNAGTYAYTCGVTVARRDNGRTQTYYTSAPHTLTIDPANMGVTVDAANPVITYDGQAHSAGVTVNKPADPSLYTVYYSSQAITATNLDALIQSGAATTTVPTYTNVKVETDANGKVSTGGAYTTYYYVKYTGAGDANHNYQDTNGFTTLTIVPKHVTLKAGTVVYHKTYDGETAVSGSAIDQNTDLGKLVHDKNIYTIYGMADTDTDKGYVIDCSANFNSIHQSEANAITISHMKVINGDGDNKGTTNYNYVFADDYTITISGYIDRLPLTLQWGGTEFTYDGQSHQPTAQISSTISAHDSDHLSVTVSGAQINRGTYNASATVSSTDAETYITDFSLSNGGQNFTIARRAITVKMDDGSATYDGNPHGPTTYTITEGTLPAGYVVTAESSKQYTNAGTYTDIKPTNVRIHNTQGEDVTDNFTITPASSTFTIHQRPVTVKGITASDKDYDGSTKAALNISRAIFTGIVSGDALSLDSPKVTGTFESANAGENKNVAITIADGALSGTSAANYVLAASGNQSTATAAIHKLVITVTPADQTITYGETPGFSVAYSGFLNGETDRLISGKDQIIYTVGKNTTSADDYASTLSVGQYTIFVNIAGLSAVNYTFTPGTGTLTIDRRPIAVTAADGANVTKTYDGTTTAAVQNSDYAFTAVAGNSASGIVNNDNVTLRYSAAYDSKDVGTPAVHMTGLSIDNGNYTLTTNAFDIAGTINPKPLTVTADNKTITYGENAPAYTSTYAGFVNGETSSVLSGTLAFTCDYDTNDATKRNAGTYTIMPSGLTSRNYTISFISGTLTVNKKEITITANNLTGIYGNPYVPDFGYTHSDLVFGEDYAKVVLGNVVYTTTVQTTDVTVNGKTTKVISSTAGVYMITPDVSGLSAQNYSFVAANGTFTINRYPLKVTQLGVNGRVYDGTNKVYDSQYDYSNVKYDGLLAIDQQYFANHPDVQRIKPTGTYDTKDAGTKKTVTLNIDPGDYLKDRCYVVEDSTSQKTATSSITPRPVLITADNQEISYGADAPSLTVSYSKTRDKNGNVVADSGLVAGESAGAANVQLSTNYVKNGDVGSYRITVDGFTKTTGSADPYNYVASYTQGTLTVKSNQLTAPQPTWDSKVPGKVTWNAVSGIGKVDVQGYTLTLYKDGAAVTDSTRTVAAGSPLEVNYSDTIHSTGAGRYTVKIKANASTENNADQKNVTDSDEGESGELYAANVTFQFASDAITQAGKGDTISIGGQSSYTMIAGETGVKIYAALKNATGYTVKSVTSDHAVVIIDNGTDSARTGASYTSTAAMNSELSVTDPITVILTLSARPATLSVTVSPQPGDTQASATYGYSETEAPSFTAKANADSGDNIGTDGYTYTYRWDYRIGQTDSHEGTASSNATWKLPTGLIANTSPTYYTVRCIVTATRKDNGQSTTTVESWNTQNAPYVTNVTINKANMTVSIKLDGWTYGKARKIPTLTSSVTAEQNPAINHVIYQYARKADADSNVDHASWSNDMPTDAGDYYVRAVIPASDNYNAFTSDKVLFTIAKNKLTDPSNLSMGASGTAAYGTISWASVNVVRENAGTDSKSEATVTYQVKLYKVEGNTETLVKTYDLTADTSMNITSDLQSGGTYTFSVTALSSNTNNVDNSDEVKSAAIPVGANIQATGTGTLKDSSYTKVYDAQSITLTASYTGTGTPSKYQWYKDGNKIAETTAPTYAVKHVDESGNYTCVVTIGEQAVYTPILNVTINKRSVTLTSGTDTQVYDGTALTKHEVTVTGDGFATGEGASYSFTGTQKNVGSSDNTFTYTLNNGTTASDYDITTAYGTLTITARSLTDNPDLTVDEIADVIYNGSAHTPEPAVTDRGRNVALIKGTDYTYSYEHNVNAGIAKVTIKGQGNYTGTIERTFTINQRHVSFSGKSAEITYDGQAHSYTNITVGGDGLAQGQTSDVCYNVSGTNVGTYDGAITKAEDIKITSGENDVTANYAITTTPGTLTIKKTDAQWRVDLPDDSVTYDGAAHYSTKAGVSHALSGETRYQYSFDGVTYYDSLQSLTRVNAGTYTIYVKATNPNYSKIATTQADLIINKRPITFSGESAAITYDGQAHSYNNITIDGLVDGQTSNVRYNVSGINAGTYNGTITKAEDIKITSGENDVTANYAITTTPGTLTINKTDAQWRVDLSDDAVTYDGKAHYSTQTATVHSLDGTTVQYAFDRDSGYVNNLRDLKQIDAGTYTIYVKATNPNYTTSEKTTTATFTINKRPITFTGESAAITYDGNTHTYTQVSASDGGLVSGHQYSVGYTLEGKNAGTYTGVIADKTKVIILSGNDDVTANYDITTTSGTLTINKTNADWRVDLDDDTVTYDGNAHHNTKTIKINSLDGTTVQYAFSKDSGYVNNLRDLKQIDAGMYTIYVKATNPNYTTAEKTTTATFTIKKRPITFSGESAEITYDGNTHTYTQVNASVGGLVNGHHYKVGYTLEGKNAGTYTGNIVDKTKVIILSGSDDVTKNYDITTANGQLIINQSEDAWTISLGDSTHTYDGQTHAMRTTPLVSDANATTDYQYSFNEADGYVKNLADLTKVDVGDYIIYVRANNTNYTTTATTTAHLIINPTIADWTIALDDDKVIYDGTDHYNRKTAVSHALSGKTSYQYSIDGVTYYDDLTSLKKVNAGKYTITVKATNPNYSKTATKTATLTIEPKPVELNWTGDTFVYDGTTKSVTAEVSNKAKADDTFTLGYDETREASAVGDYSARVISLGNDNYTLESATGIDHNWSIRYLATDASATVSGTTGKNDWYVGSDTKLNAPAGYQISLNENDWASSISYSKDGQYTDVQYKLKNTKTGQITDFKTISFKVDQTAPTGIICDSSKDITKSDSTITYHYIYPDQVTVTIAADDQKDLSGVDTIEYQIVTKDQTYDPKGTWQSYTQAFNIPANTEAVVYAKITDKAGNVSTIHTDGLVVYTNATDKDNINYTLTTGQDQTSGIAFNGNTVKIVKLGDTTLTEGKDYRVKDDKLIIDGAYLETLSAGDHTLIVSWNPLGETGNTVGTRPKDSTMTVHVLKHDGQVTVTQDLTKTYDGRGAGNPAYTSKSTGTATYLYKKAADPDDAYSTIRPTDAGNYIVKVIVGTDSKYKEASGTRAFTISKRKVTFTGVSDTITYDSQAHSYTNITVGGDGLAQGQTSNVSYSVSGTNVGTYDGAITKAEDIKITVDGRDVTADYAITSTAGKLIIKKSDVAWTISLDNATHIYDGQPHAMNTTPSVSDLNGTTTYWYSFDEGEGYVGHLTDLTKVEAGDYIIYVKADNTNYNTTATTTAHLIINPTTAAWTIALDKDAVTYDGAAHYSTKAGVSHALSGETRYQYSFDGVTYYDGLKSLTKVNAGIYTIYVRATNPNYSKMATTQADLIINKRPITFTGESAAITYDGSTHTYTQVNTSGDGLASGHKSNVTYNLVGTKVGNYSGTLTQNIQITDAQDNDVTKNYDITTHNGALTITARSINDPAEFSVDEIDNVTYDGSVHTPEPMVMDTGRQVVLVKDTDLTYSYKDNVNAGTATVTITGKGNYAGTIERTFTIKKRPITFRGESAAITYDGQAHSYNNITIDGLLDGHTSDVRYSVSGTNAGTYNGTITKAENIKITDGDKDVTANYAVTSAAGQLTIGKKDIAKATVILGELVKFNNQALTQRILSVVLDGLTVTYTVDGDTASQPGVYTMTLTGTGNFTGTCTKPWVLTADQNGKIGDVEGNINVDVQLKNEAPKTDLITSKASVIQIAADANEMSAVADGAVLDIWLENTDISDTISHTSKDAFKKKATDLIIGAYVDISLYKQLYINDQAQARMQLHNVARPIWIVMKLPKYLINNDANYRRSYKLLRLHDGVVEMIPVDYNAQNQTLTFSSDKFSEYAIVYADVYIGKSAMEKDNWNHSVRMLFRTATARGNAQHVLSAGSITPVQRIQRTSAQSNGAVYATGSPKTGDDQMIGLWLILMLVSCFGVGAAMKGRRKKA